MEGFMKAVSAVVSSRLARRASILALALASASPTFAQSGDPAGADDAGNKLGDIVVTAQKRAENVQDVPVAVTAMGGENLLNRQVSDLLSLSQNMPNVNFGQNLGQARIAIRGLGLNVVNPGVEGRVAFHLDGIYISRPGAILGTFFDVDRIEVLRGPQGTLYGRNAVGGSVNLVTRNPTTEYSGFAEATVGNYDRVTLEAGVGGPISDTISFRIAGQTNDRGGYGKNVVTGDDIDDLKTRAVRGKIDIHPSDAFNLLLSADYARQDDHSGAYHYAGQIIPGTVTSGVALGGNLPNNPARNLATEAPVGFETELYGFGATANLELSDDLTLTSVTGYRRSSVRLQSDIDLTDGRFAPYDTREKSRQFSEELRLTYHFDKGNWIVGAYYFDEHIRTLLLDPQDIRLLVPTAPPLFVNAYAAGGTLDTRSYAIFSQLDYNLTDQFSVTVGGRYNSDRKKVDEFLQFDLARPYNPNDPILPLATQQASRTFNSFTPKLGLQYKPNDDFMLFASWSKGFKSGSYNLGAVGPAFKPEKLTAYEVGLKSDLADRTLRFNLSAFYYDYSDLQVNKTLAQNVVIENAASAKLYGAEAEILFVPIEALRVDVNAAYTHSKYKDYLTEDAARPALGLIDLSGNKLEQAPEFSGTVGIEYAVPAAFGTVTPRVEMFYTSKVYFSQYNLDTVAEGSYALFNAFLNFKAGGNGLYGSLFVKNIGNITRIANAIPGSAIVNNPVQATYIPPRTYGLRVGYRF
jgi:iron complex outermembrane receptor protein